MGSAPVQLERLPKPTVKFPERCCGATSVKGSAEPCPGSTEPALPWPVLVLTLASGALLASFRKDAGEADGGSGEGPALLGTILREAPGWSCPALDRTRPWLQASFGAGRTWKDRVSAPGLCRRQRSAHSRLYLSTQKAPCGWKARAPPRPCWKAEVRGAWGPGASALPAALLGLLASAEWGLSWEPSYPRAFLDPRPLPTPSVWVPGVDPVKEWASFFAGG